MSFRNKKPKTPPAIAESFPTDETPTPTRILKMADMDLFGELKVGQSKMLGENFLPPGFFGPVQWKREPLRCSLQKSSRGSQARQQTHPPLPCEHIFLNIFPLCSYIPQFSICSTPGADSLSATVTAREDVEAEESLNTPQIYCTEASQAPTQSSSSCSTVSTTATSVSPAQPVILKVPQMSI